jgi:hypothetical protein
MADFKTGDAVLAVEYRDLNGGERTGRTHRARIDGTEGMYYQVAYDDPGVYRGGRDVFYQSSGWRAWCGDNWRLEPVDAEADQ